jgi:hypothetical protein
LSRLLLLLIFLTACSHTIGNQKNADIDGQTVDVENKSIEETTAAQEILIDDGRYGPTGTGTNELATEQGAAKKTFVIAAIMPIAKYSLYAYVGLLKSFEFSDLKIRIINGTGAGAYFSSFLANQGTSSLLEWNILKEFGDNVEMDNRKNNEEDFSNVFSINTQTKIEELTHLLFISTYNKNNNKIEFYNKGKLAPVLKRSFQSSAESNLIFPTEVLKKRGADKVVAFVFEEEEFIKQTNNDYLLGQYNKMMTRVTREKNNLDYLCKIKIKIATEKQIIIKNVYEQAIRCTLEINKLVAL